MNVEEEKTVNVCPENNSKDVSKKQYFEEQSTPRRSTRIRQTKKVIEAYNKKVEKFNEVSSNFEIPKEVLVKPINASSTIAKSENNSVQNLNGDYKLSNTLFQGDDGEQESLESSFDENLEQTNSTTLSPKKSSNDFVNERKFIKTNLSYVCNQNNLPNEDVNKVFKIISKPYPNLSNITAESTSPIKPLKTYSNKRKTFQKADVVESFGLPDHPITLDNTQPLNKELDVTLEDDKETVSYMEFVSEPWIITAEGEDEVPIFEEIRTKSDPIYYPFMKNGSFFDFDFESFIDPTILTTSYNPQVSSKDGSIPNDMEINIVQKNKEIDIEAIKINFKKILCKNDLPETQEQVKVKKTRHSTSKKKGQVSKDISSVNSNISFVEGDSLTVDNEELEISNNLIVPKCSKLDKSKNISKRNSLSKNKKKLGSSLNSEDEEGIDIEKAKSVLKSTPRKRKVTSVTEIKESADDNLPKKISEADNLISNSRCNLRTCNVEKNSIRIQHKNVKTEEETNQGTINSGNVKKRKLRSNNQRITEINDCGIQNNPDNSTNEIKKGYINKTVNDDAFKDHKSFGEMADTETLKKHVKPTNLLMKRTVDTMSNSKNKRLLRSSSQDLLEQVDPFNNTATFNKPKTNIICTTDMKVSLQKCDFKGDFNSLITDTTCDRLSREIFEKDKIAEKLLSPLKKGRKVIPEITIILKPLDISKFDPRLLESSKTSCSDMLPTAKKNIPSIKAVLHVVKANQSENYNNASDLSRTKCKESAPVFEETNIVESVNDEKFVERNKLSQCEINMVKTTNNVDSVKMALDAKMKNTVKDKVCKLKDSNNAVLKNKKVQTDSFITKIKNNELFQRENIHFSSLHEKDSQNLPLATNKSLETENLQVNSDQVTEKRVSSEIKPLNNTDKTRNIDYSELNHVDSSTAISEKNKESVVETKAKSIKKNEKNNEHVPKSNLKEQNIELGISDDLSDPASFSLLNSENKNKVKQTKLDKPTSSDLWKKEEDKSIMNTSLYQQNSTEILNQSIGTLSKNNMVHETKNLEQPPECNSVISDKKETDSVKENKTSFDNLFIKNLKVKDYILNYNNIQEKTDMGKQEQELKDKRITVQSNSSFSQECTGEMFAQQLSDREVHSSEKQTANNSLTLPAKSSVLVQTALEVNTESVQKEIKPNINIENALTSINSKDDGKLERLDKPSGCSARLKEKRKKLQGGKSVSSEEGLKKNEQLDINNSISPRENVEKTVAANCLDGTGIEQPIIIRKRGRPRTRKPDISENLSMPQIQTNPRGRPRKTALDDMDLLNKYKGYQNDRIRRSKSVARSMLEIERKPNRSDRWKPTEDFISYHTRSRDSNKDKDIDLLSCFKKSELLNKKSKTEAISIPKINSSNNNLASENNTKIKPNKEVPENNIKQNMYVKKSQSIGTVPNASVEDIPGNGDFAVGNITWAQIGSHPFWPCLVTKEPGTGYYKKIFQGKRFRRELYHVRFFGDNGRRAWINKQQILLYSNRKDLINFQNKLRAQNKPIPPGYIVKTKTLQKWECAVDEAEQLKMKNIKEKLLFFSDIKNVSKSKESTINDLRKHSPTSTKRKLSEDIEVEEKCLKPPLAVESEVETPQAQKKYKRNVSNEHKTLTEDNVPQRDDSENAHHVENMEESNQQTEHILTRMLLKRQIDENSEISSKTSSDYVTDTSLNSMEIQKAMYKRNNLFKGISRDKVCQYCFKPGDVLKCRGRCNGSFHVPCSLKILQEKSPKKKRERNTKIKNIGGIKTDEIVNPKSTSISCTGENPDHKMKTETYYKGEDYKVGLTEEEQVQIITVPSSVYNTPPRKTFPPDFKNMTLAEQIDYKMKEIMKKFETKTFYSETSSESSSEDLLGKQVARICPNNAYIGVGKNDFELKLTVHEIIKSDVSKISNNMERIIAGKKIEKKVTSVVKKKLFIRHVTADSENMKSDSSQEEKLSTDDESFESTKTLDPKNFKCGFCIADMYPYCFICHLAVSKKGSTIRQKCSIYQCGRFYHPDCLKMWPQTQWSLIQTTRHKDSDKDMDSFVCPLHVCHTCVSDDPRAATSRCSGDKIVKCLRCPSTYHSSNLCVPAGTAILSSSQIVCPRHREKSKLITINTTWCFLCSAGGNLICCETCPTSVHPECLPVNLTDDDKFICEDCESGRLPLYDEIVWVKLGKFRWWPAVILFPNEVPDNIRKMKHSIGEFVVKFFGTYDYYWVNRGRSFLFQEGDTGQCNSVKKKVDAAFNRAVEEAVVAHKLKKEFKLSQEVESISSLKPPPYIRIKVNKPVGNVRHLDLDLSSTNACECDPNKPHPCGPESDCLNRLLLTECNPEICPAGKRCKNQSFEKREYPPLVPYKTQGRGWGLKTLAPIKKSQFVVEYVGELIDSEEYQRRIQKMHEQKEENYYFLTIDKDRMIDAGPKGNVARFMNHCCQPNCETQKWTVNGDTRVGLFATEDIAVDTELTFNYNLECVGKEKKVCRCGAPNCSGFIGVKAKHDSDVKKQKKPVKRKTLAEPVILPPCFICGKMDNVISCNNKVCNKTYHQECLKTTKPVEGNRFICPWHNCNICAKRTIRCCVKCINSYCPSHSDGNIRYDNLLGFVCTNHDPMTSPNDVQPTKHKRKKSDVVTEESAVSSTTSDDAEDDEDWMPSSTRLKRMSAKHSTSIESETDIDSNITKSLKRISHRSDHESQDEGAVSSATASNVGEENVIKRKRGRPKKNDQLEMKIRLSSVQKTGITASSSPVDDKFRDHSSSELCSRHNELENS